MKHTDHTAKETKVVKTHVYTQLSSTDRDLFGMQIALQEKASYESIHC